MGRLDCFAFIVLEKEAALDRIWTDFKLLIWYVASYNIYVGIQTKWMPYIKLEDGGMQLAGEISRRFAVRLYKRAVTPRHGRSRLRLSSFLPLFNDYLNKVKTDRKQVQVERITSQHQAKQELSRSLLYL